MPILALSEMASKQKERKVLEGVPGSERWTVRCMFTGCEWNVSGLLSEDAGITAGKLHHKTHGHPCRLRTVIEFDCGGVIR